jgi:hypothetical protein
MIECAREDAEALVRKTLCSCFLAVDGTITLRREKALNAAKAVASCLASHGLLESSVDFRSIQRAICAFVQPNGESAVPVSVPASDVADRICAAMYAQQLAA